MQVIIKIETGDELHFEGTVTELKKEVCRVLEMLENKNSLPVNNLLSEISTHNNFYNSNIKINVLVPVSTDSIRVIDTTKKN